MTNQYEYLLEKLDDKLCEHCLVRKSTVKKKDPFCQWLNPNEPAAMWEYCDTCYNQQYELVKIVVEKFKDNPEQLKEILADVRSNPK